jgi:hypothetical protein
LTNVSKNARPGNGEIGGLYSKRQGKFRNSWWKRQDCQAPRKLRNAAQVVGRLWIYMILSGSIAVTALDKQTLRA